MRLTVPCLPACPTAPGQRFESPSAFAIFIKRLSNPTRKADDGWKSVKYAGKVLEYYKDRWLLAKAAEAQGGGGRGGEQEGTEDEGGRGGAY